MPSLDAGRPAWHPCRARIFLRGICEDRDMEPAGQARLAAAGVTAREAEVLAVIGARQTNQEIAGRLCISVRTVESHVSSLLRKLGLSSTGLRNRWRPVGVEGLDGLQAQAWPLARSAWPQLMPGRPDSGSGEPQSGESYRGNSTARSGIETSFVPNEMGTRLDVRAGQFPGQDQRVLGGADDLEQHPASQPS